MCKNKRANNKQALMNALISPINCLIMLIGCAINLSQRWQSDDNVMVMFKKE